MYSERHFENSIFCVVDLVGFFFCCFTRISVVMLSYIVETLNRKMDLFFIWVALDKPR